jgi:hypothetical protein
VFLEIGYLFENMSTIECENVDSDSREDRVNTGSRELSDLQNALDVFNNDYDQRV